MPLYQHHVLVAPPRGAHDLARRVLETGGARIFGVFTSQIGLSANHVVAIGAVADGADDLAAGAEIERQELWEADPRPVDGESLPETDGFFSHRWWNIADADWFRFRELSVDAWDNFEDAHDTRVIGFWRSRERPAPGQTRVWLMAWYKSLAAWEGSRWYLDPDRAHAARAYANFRARHELTLDTAVSLLRRVA